MKKLILILFVFISLITYPVPKAKYLGTYTSTDTCKIKRLYISSYSSTPLLIVNDTIVCDSVKVSGVWISPYVLNNKVQDTTRIDAGFGLIGFGNFTENRNAEVDTSDIPTMRALRDSIAILLDSIAVLRDSINNYNSDIFGKLNKSDSIGTGPKYVTRTALIDSISNNDIYANNGIIRDGDTVKLDNNGSAPLMDDLVITSTAAKSITLGTTKNGVPFTNGEFSIDTAHVQIGVVNYKNNDNNVSFWGTGVSINSPYTAPNERLYVNGNVQIDTLKATVNGYYGEMYCNLATAKDYGNPADNIWLPLDTFATGLVYGFTFTGLDSVDYLNCQYSGLYEITYNIEFSVQWANSPPESKIGIFINNTLYAKSVISKYAANNVSQNISNSFLINLSAGDKIKMKVWQAVDVDDFTQNSGSITIRKL